MNTGRPESDDSNPRLDNSAAAADLPDARAADDQQMLEAISHSLDSINLGFDIKVLDVLEDENSRPAEIEALKDRLGELVALRLFSVANSNYYGKLRSGKITRFLDVVKHLGADTTRSMAIFIALLSRADSSELRSMFARSFAIAKLAEILAYRFGMKPAERSLLGLSGLFAEIGRIFIILDAKERRREPDHGFTERCHPRVTEMVIAKFGLPEVLADIINHPELAFAGEDELPPSAVIRLARSVTEQSFARNGKLVLESPMPDPDHLLYQRTVGSILAGQFQSIGLGEYLQVIVAELTDQEKYLYEKRRRELDSSA